MTSTPDWLGLLRLHTERFAGLLGHADLGAPIASCPGWSLHDLADHRGGVHQWAAYAVVGGNPQFEVEHVEPGSDELVAWYRRHAAHLVDVLTERPVDAPAWTMDPDDGTAGFRRRRQVHETVLHTWDAEAATVTPRRSSHGWPWTAFVKSPRSSIRGRCDLTASHR